MSLWRYSFGFLLIVFFIAFALANDDSVKIYIYLNLIKEGGQEFLYLPIYVIVFLTLFLGVLIGTTIEHIRYVKLRNLLRQRETELREKKIELDKNKERFFSEEEKIMDMLN
tara:strand:- start:397 stop:732 length:336 start_codon:yes stop_codon:yes gene_type:complete